MNKEIEIGVRDKEMEEDVLRARECWRMKWTAAMEPAMELRRYSRLRVKATRTGERLQTVVRVQLLGRHCSAFLSS